MYCAVSILDFHDVPRMNGFLFSRSIQASSDTGRDRGGFSQISQVVCFSARFEGTDRIPL